MPHWPYAPIFETTRGEIVESIHFGAIAVVSSDGKLLASYGDPYALTYLRSSAKPLQVLPFIEDGGQGAFNLTPREIALMCASHVGTDEHMAVLAGLQEKTGVAESDLLCGTHPLGYKPAAKALQERGQAVTPNRHNCSGKHTGMLAYARYLGVPTEEYVNPDHPVQQNIRNVFAEMAGLQRDQVHIGVDGCSAPNFAVPIYHAALAIAHLCDPQGARDHLSEKRRQACQTITQAMLAHPEIVAGPESFDTRLMAAAGGNVLAKGGAEGYQVLGLMPGCLNPGSSGAGIAYKISDGDLKSRGMSGGYGSGLVRPAVGIEILRQLGALPPEALESLADFGPSFQLNNWRGLHVGEGRPCFRLDTGPGTKAPNPENQI